MDYCCEFSFDFPVPKPVKGWLREVIELIDNTEGGEDLDEGSPLYALLPNWNEYGEAGFDISHNPDTNQCCISSDDQGNTDMVCTFLLAFLAKCYEAEKKFREIGFTYAEHGDGVYGGGAIRCFLDGSTPESEWITVDGWLSKAFRGAGN